MNSIIGSAIIVENPSVELQKWCSENLILSNPEYHKAVAMGRWTGRIPREFQLYTKNGNKLVIPFGCLKSVWNKLANAPYSLDFASVRRFNYESNINLYDYQEDAVEAILKARNGIVVMPCGAGKTQTALESIARIGGKALWLTHTQDLLNQSLTRAKSVFGADNRSYGTITGGKVNIGTGLTLATVQTMAKINLSEYRHAWDIVVVDECHKAVGTPTKVMQFYKVLTELSCRYKIGLTATPYRADGLERCMFALLGDVIHEVPKEAVAETTCPVKVRFVHTGYFPECEAVLAGDGTINYAALVDDMTHNKQRFQCVLDALNALDGSVLVLGNRVDYLSRLQEAVSKKSICLSSLGNSKSAKMVRKDALQKLNNGELDCVFATYQLAKEGLDVPNLKYVVFATPEKDKTTVMQAAGRVGRKADGKEFGTVIDFVDNFGMFRGWQKKRAGLYKKLGYEILPDD